MTPNKLTFTSHDGQVLCYRHWPAETPSNKHVILFHRGHEHGGRQQHIVEELAQPDTDFYAWDARGHGENGGPRGYADNFGVLIRDAQAFAEHLKRAHGVELEATVVIAQSVGAVIASAWAHRYAPRLRGMVLASPAFSVKLYVPGAVPGLKLLQAIRGTFFVNSYVKAHYLTHDPVRQKSFNEDPLITRPIASNILLELYEVAEQVVSDAQAITTPTLMLVSGDDFVVRKEPQQRFFANLGSTEKEYVELPGFYHDTLGELHRESAFVKIRSFLAKRFTQPFQAATHLADAHTAGYTFEEYRSLKQPLPPFSLKNLQFALTRNLMAGPGRMSKGIDVGFQTGFDSGSMLDYVYRNEPTGSNAVGRFFDKQYLQAIGWRGIRQRRQNLIETLARAIEEVRAQGLPVRIVDVAAGAGRYILDALVKVGLNEGDSALLRDYSDINVQAGRALIAEHNLTGRVEFVQGDAFDQASLEALTPRPTIVVVSGLYELFPDNAMLQRSLAGIATALQPGGKLIYTCQPWHPQLEFIARVLTSHRQGTDWVMRRRTQLEMDELVRAHGLSKETGIADQWGIFTVSMATKA